MDADFLHSDGHRDKRIKSDSDNADTSEGSDVYSYSKSCSECGKTFFSEKYYLEHLQIHKVQE